jgi:4-carboxymuconolactone decarboxylase
MSTSVREKGLALLLELLPDLLTDETLRTSMSPGGFGTGLGELTLDTVFGAIWTRPGLDRRSRSLVTLGVLIALRAEDELKLHLKIGLRNGLTREELEEVVYHAAGYAGFPAAATAARIGREVLDSDKPLGELIK